jgi:hypothetical protein
MHRERAAALGGTDRVLAATGVRPGREEAMNRRPWVTDAVIRESETNPYAEYSAWESWFYRNYDDLLPDGEEPVSDSLSVTQKAYLFNLMGRLADGDGRYAAIPDFSD